MVAMRRGWEMRERGGVGVDTLEEARSFGSRGRFGFLESRGTRCLVSFVNRVMSCCSFNGCGAATIFCAVVAATRSCGTHGTWDVSVCRSWSREEDGDEPELAVCADPIASP